MAAAAPLALLAACATGIPEGALRLPPEAAADREAQTRRYEGITERELLATGAGVLQDLGFAIDESETRLGIVVASKERSAIDEKEVTAAYLLTLLSILVLTPTEPNYAKRQVLRVALVTRPVPGDAAGVRRDARARHVPAPRVRQPRSPPAPGGRHRAGALSAVLRSPVARRLPGGRVAMNCRPLHHRWPDDRLRGAAGGLCVHPAAGCLRNRQCARGTQLPDPRAAGRRPGRALRAVIATLQDLGFVLDSADATLGTVTATKLAQHQVRMTVSVRQVDDRQVLVRANADYSEPLAGRSAVRIEDPATYQDFFQALERSAFLAAQNVE